MSETRYEHHVLCSGDRRFPAGTPGHCCSCFTMQIPGAFSPAELSAVGHCVSYLEGMLLRDPEHSCESIKASLDTAMTGFKRNLMEAAVRRRPVHFWGDKITDAFCGVQTLDRTGNPKSVTCPDCIAKMEVSRDGANAHLAKLASERYDELLEKDGEIRRLTSELAVLRARFVDYAGKLFWYAKTVRPQWGRVDFEAELRNRLEPGKMTRREQLAVVLEKWPGDRESMMNEIEAIFKEEANEPSGTSADSNLGGM